jgi:NDP-sugar pyrophosphorylase family protein
MVPICGKGALAHMLDVLPESVTDVVVVVGYLREQIEAYFGREYLVERAEHNERAERGGVASLLPRRYSMHYVFQAERKGTGDALFLCRDRLKDVPRFLVCMGDDVHSARDIASVSCAGEHAVLVKTCITPFSGGAVVVDEHNALLEIREGTHMPPVRVNAAVYALTPCIFTYPLVAIKNGAEYGLPQTIVTMARDAAVHVVEARDWVQVTELADIPKAEAYLKSIGRCT